MRDGVRVINCARGELIDDAALKDALDSGQGRRRGAGRVPERADHGLSAVRGLSQRGRHAAPGRLDDRGAGPRRRADRRADGRRAHRRRRLDRGEHPRDRARGHGGAQPVPPARRPARPARQHARARGRPDRDRVHRPDRRARHAPAHARHPARRPEPGRRRTSTSSTPRASPRSAASASPSARRPSRATSPTSCASPIVCGEERYRVAGTTLGRRHRPHLLEAWGQRFNLQLDEDAHLALFRYPNRPGMLGRVGTALGEHGINISTATQGVHRTDDDLNVVIVVTDADIPDDGDGRGARRAGHDRRARTSGRAEPARGHRGARRRRLRRRRSTPSSARARSSRSPCCWRSATRRSSPT